MSDMAGFDQSGHQESPTVMPYSLTFVPHSDVANLFPKDLGDKKYMKYVDQLKSIPSNSNLYDIYAFDKPVELGGQESYIGTLTLDGSLTSSKWGDETLFFRHQKMNDDVKMHPEWIPYLATYSLGGKCPMGY